jgi:putative FmdB family regulatory protein
MPRYDYICRDCGEPFTLRVSMAAYSAGVHPACSACGSTMVERSFSTVSVLTSSRGGSRPSGTDCGSTGFT